MCQLQREQLVQGLCGSDQWKPHMLDQKELGKERERGQVVWDLHGHRKTFRFYSRLDGMDFDEGKTPSDPIS